MFSQGGLMFCLSIFHISESPISLSVPHVILGWYCFIESVLAVLTPTFVTIDWNWAALGNLMNK